LRLKDKRTREPRHDSWGPRHCILEVESCKYRCKDCGRTFWQRFPGILPRKRATEPFRRQVFVAHYDGINRSRLGERMHIGSATVERWFQDFLRRESAERRSADCPRILGIDEHFFSRKDGYATTFCDLRRHTDVRVDAPPTAERSSCFPAQPLHGVTQVGEDLNVREAVNVIVVNLHHPAQTIDIRLDGNEGAFAFRFEHFPVCQQSDLLSREVDLLGGDGVNQLVEGGVEAGVGQQTVLVGLEVAIVDVAIADGENEPEVFVDGVMYFRSHRNP
jgi:hypothetical protein